MPEYTDRVALVEVEIFTGSPTSAESFGLYESRYTDRDATRPPWNTQEEVEPFWTFDGRTEVLPGTIFSRQSEITAGPAQRQVGNWVEVGETRTEAGRAAAAQRFVRVASNWEATSAPGAPMRTLNGLRMYELVGEDWDPLTRPAVGEQDISNLDGTLLWEDEEETIPTLVI